MGGAIMCDSQDCQSSVAEVEVVINFKGDNSFYMGTAEFEKWVLFMAKEGRGFSFLFDEKNENSFVVGRITRICLKDASSKYGLSIFIVTDWSSSDHCKPSRKWTKIPPVKMK